MNFKPLSNAFQDAGQAIKAGDPRIHWIDVSWPSFLAQKDLPPVELPPQHSPKEVTAPREETAFSRFSLEAEIDQFHFEEEEGVPERLVELSDSKAELDRLSATHSPRLVVTQIEISSEEEEMALNPRRSLRDLVAGRKGSSSKDALKTQLPPNPPLPPLPSLPSPLSLYPDPNLQKKKRKGRLPHQRSQNSKKTNNGRQRETLVESKEDPLRAAVRRPQHTWAPRLELDGTSIP